MMEGFHWRLAPPMALMKEERELCARPGGTEQGTSAR